MNNVQWRTKYKTLIIIDEAQLTYTCRSFWIDFINPLASDRAVNGPIVVLFSSYGSPFELSFEETAPIQLHAGQRVSIRPRYNTNLQVSLYFTRLEFDDVVARVCKAESELGHLFDISAELSQYVWEITSGHPGATRVILDFLAHVDVCEA